MVAMGVRAQYPAQPVTHRFEQHIAMRIEFGTGIDQRQSAVAKLVADEIGIGTRPGHHAGIGRRHAPHTGRDRDNITGDDGIQRGGIQRGHGQAPVAAPASS